MPWVAAEGGHAILGFIEPSGMHSRVAVGKMRQHSKTYQPGGITWQVEVPPEAFPFGDSTHARRY
jgi:hypothetical protein